MKHKKMFRMIIIGMIIWGILWASVCNDSINVTNAATSSVDVEIQSKQNCNIIQEKKEKKKKEKKNNEEKNNGKTWNQKMIHVENVTGEKSVKVAIIDSGVNYSSDINVVVRKNFIEDECNILYEDVSGHGTAVAGLIAAMDNGEGITGINSGVEIYSARVLDDNLEAPVDRIVAAINWAIEQECDIINMSFGIQENVFELEQAIERADAAGILMIAAVGSGDKIAFPAAYDEVIAVGAVNAKGEPSVNSAKGVELEIMAPGDNLVASAIFDGTLGVTGTSFAAPHVTGAASILWERNPEMPADYIRALLDYSANLYGNQDEYGNGLVDISYALEINDKFKKVYNKNIDKSEKNKNQKEKQKNKFWGEVLKSIPENEKAVETFTEIDVVEGFWGTNVHSELAQTAGDQLEDETENSRPIDQISFTYTQMQIMIRANRDADEDSKLRNMDANPYHGYYQSYKDHDDTSDVTSADYPNRKDVNYVANYIYLTKRANYFGVGITTPIDCSSYIQNFDALSVSRKQMIEIGKSRIDSDITENMIGSMEWSKALNAVNVPATNENRKFYIWGLALHCATDVTSHSGYAMVDGEWKHIKHYIDGLSYADNVNYLPERYDVALEIAKNVLYHAYYGSAGLIIDFRVSGDYFGNFYLKNIADYSRDVSSLYYNAFTNDFNAMDYDKQVLH